MLLLVATLSLLVVALVAVTWACWRRDLETVAFSVRRPLKRAIPEDAESYLASGSRIVERFLLYGIGVSWRRPIPEP